MKPLFPYPGGKSKLLKSILPFLPKGIQTYVEPFAGGLAVLLAHDTPFPREIVNDLNAELINFYRVAARHPEALIAELDGFYAARDSFENELRFPEIRTELGRAASWYWIQRQSFGGKRQHFGRCRDVFHGVDVLRDGQLIRDFSARAKDVVFSSGDACDAIRQHDSHETFFFADPPYVDCADTAYLAFTEVDMARIRDVLASCKGRWILTCDDSAATRRVFDGFWAVGNTIKYTLARNCSGRISSELMVFSENLATDFLGKTSRMFPLSRPSKVATAQTA